MDKLDEFLENHIAVLSGLAHMAAIVAFGVLSIANIILLAER